MVVTLLNDNDDSLQCGLTQGEHGTGSGGADGWKSQQMHVAVKITPKGKLGNPAQWRAITSHNQLRNMLFKTNKKIKGRKKRNQACELGELYDTTCLW